MEPFERSFNQMHLNGSTNLHDVFGSKTEFDLALDIVIEAFSFSGVFEISLTSEHMGM